MSTPPGVHSRTRLTPVRLSRLSPSENSKAPAPSSRRGFRRSFLHGVGSQRGRVLLLARRREPGLPIFPFPRSIPSAPTPYGAARRKFSRSPDPVISRSVNCLRVRRAALLVPLAAILLPAGAAHAQRDVKVGDVWVRTHRAAGEDRSLALVFADSSPGAGTLMWACEGGGLVPGIRQLRLRLDGAPRRVVVRFDAEAPDTLTLQGAREVPVWLVDPAEGERFTRRVQAASRLAITVPPDSAGWQGAEYRYALREAGPGLQRLECGTDAARRRGRPAGRATLQRAANVPWADSRGRLTDREWEQLPQLTNPRDLQRHLARNYPPPLRDRGVEGEVHVRFRVLEDGRVDSASVHVTSTTHPLFNPVAIQAALIAVFQPARVYERPVKVWIELPFQFSFPAR
jgi:TonB family protein